MKEKPILFSTAMVQAIMEGRKTQTRRVVKSNPLHPKWTGKRWVESGNDDTIHYELKCPYGKKGDLLWVRETWGMCPDYNESRYKADKGMDRAAVGGKWKPSIFMPKKYCRLWLEVVDVRVERLQDIVNPHDQILKEGWPFDEKCYGKESPVESWIRLWNSINEKRGYSWQKNPWVWVVEFKKIEGVSNHA